MRTAIEDRLLRKVEYDPNGGCWLSLYSPDRHGYGRFKLGQRCVSVHRVAYQTLVGPVPEGMHVLHLCDVRACINPNHLFLGTHKDNMADRTAKGRDGRVAGGHHKLTPSQIEEAMRLRMGGIMSRGAIAKKFGVNGSTIRYHARKLVSALPVVQGGAK